MSDKRILRSERGVTLTTVELVGNGAVVARQFVVATKREPVEKNFRTEQEAVEYFDAEVKRCTSL